MGRPSLSPSFFFPPLGDVLETWQIERRGVCRVFRVRESLKSFPGLPPFRPITPEDGKGAEESPYRALGSFSPSRAPSSPLSPFFPRGR